MSEILYSPIAKLQEDTYEGRGYPKADGMLTCANVQIAQVTVPFTGTALAAGDAIAICRLPSGAMLVPELSSVVSEGIGSLGVSLGTDADPAAYMAAASIGSAGVYPCKGGSVAHARKPLDSSAMLKATVTTAGTPTAGKHVTFVIAYTSR